MKPHQLAKLFNQSSTSGFSIVEALVGILVASALLTAIAPVLVISTATRVQARRIELAAQAARTYIDGIKTGTITTLPPLTTANIDQFAVPTSGSLTCNANSYCTAPASPANSLYCIDRNGNADNTPDGKCTNSSSQDIVIQAFRRIPAGVTVTNNYQLAIRVYRADAFQGTDVLKRNAPTAPATESAKATALTYATALGDRKAPLLEMTTEINPNQPSYNDLCARLGGCKP
jgi:type II secretory pathway pseudopilin PulG